MTKLRKQIFIALFLTIFILGNFASETLVSAESAILNSRMEQVSETKECRACNRAWENEDLIAVGDIVSKEHLNPQPAPTVNQTTDKVKKTSETSPPPLRPASPQVTPAPAPVVVTPAPAPVVTEAPAPVYIQEQAPAPESYDLVAMSEILPKTGENRVPTFIASLSLLSLSAVAFVLRKNLNK